MGLRTVDMIGPPVVDGLRRARPLDVSGVYAAESKLGGFGSGVPGGLFQPPLNIAEKFTIIWSSEVGYSQFFAVMTVLLAVSAER